MQVQLIKPCAESVRLLKPIVDGYDCLNCGKPVIDYSEMSDAEMFIHMQKHGLGCGKWKPEQLNRDLKLTGKRKLNPRIFYAALISALWLRPSEVKAQSVPDTMQMPFKPSQKPKQSDTVAKPQMLDEIVIISYGNTTRHFGTGNAAYKDSKTEISSTPIKKWWKSLFKRKK